jgi:hypothetical protein
MLWSRAAILCVGLVALEAFLVKDYRPHYFAPAAPLLLALQMDTLRLLWSARRTAAGQRYVTVAAALVLVCGVTAGCLVTIGARLVQRPVDVRRDAINIAVPSHDWSYRRQAVLDWLRLQEDFHLVFVRYGENHNVSFEWVFNESDIVGSQVVWARDLGDAANRALAGRLKNRRTWLIRSDENRWLEPYLR